MVTPPKAGSRRGRVLGGGRPRRSCGPPRPERESRRANRRSEHPSRPPRADRRAPGQLFRARHRSGTACCAPRRRAATAGRRGRPGRAHSHRPRSRTDAPRAAVQAPQHIAPRAARTTSRAPRRNARRAASRRPRCPTDLGERADSRLREPLQAEAASLKVVDRTQRHLRADLVGDVTDRPGQPNARNAVDRVSVLGSDRTNMDDQPGQRGWPPTARADQLDRRIRREPVDAVQPGGGRVRGEEPATAGMRCHPQPLVHGGRCSREDQHTGDRLPDQPVGNQPPHVARRQPELGGLLTGEGTVLSGPEPSRGADGVVAAHGATVLPRRSTMANSRAKCRGWGHPCVVRPDTSGGSSGGVR